MEIRVLKYFLAVAKHESIVKAAEALFITQPTLSRQIMELEEELKVTLLARGKRNKGIVLTEEGMLLRQRAEEILDLVSKTEADFNTPEEVISGDIYIGSGETDAVRIIAKTIKDLQKDYPHIRYHLYSGNAEDVTERLDKGLLDFGILIEPADIKKYDYFRLPAKDTWGLIMRKDSHLAQNKTIKAKDLVDIPLLVSRQALVDNQISGWRGQSVERLNVVATYNLVFNASLLVDEGVGYALTLDKLVNTSLESNLLFIPLEPTLEANLNIVWKKHQVFSKVAQKFLERLQVNI